MMYGLPESTAMRNPIPKESFFKSKNITGKEKERFDLQVHKITLLGRISPDTVNIEPTSDIKAIYVIEVQLNDPEFDERIIDSLERLGYKTIYVLSYQDRCKLAVVEGTKFFSKWEKEETIRLEMVGLDLGEVWASFVRSIGGLTEEGDFGETIEKTVKNGQIQKEIYRLENKLAKSKQNHEQREIFAKIQELKKQLL